MKPIRLILCVAGLGVILIGNNIFNSDHGLGSSRVNAKPFKSSELPPRYVIAVDRSGSTDQERDDQLGILFTLSGWAADDGREVEVWAVDSRATLIRTAMAERPEREIFLKDLSPKPGAKDRHGTRPALFWEEMSERYEAPKRPVRIVYLTDGGNDAPEDSNRLHRAVERLSQNLNLLIAVIGVNPRFQKAVEEEMKPFQDRVLITRGGQTGQDALKDWWLRSEASLR